MGNGSIISVMKEKQPGVQTPKTGKYVFTHQVSNLDWEKYWSSRRKILTSEQNSDRDQQTTVLETCSSHSACLANVHYFLLSVTSCQPDGAVAGWTGLQCGTRASEWCKGWTPNRCFQCLSQIPWTCPVCARFPTATIFRCALQSFPGSIENRTAHVCMTVWKMPRN